MTIVELIVSKKLIVLSIGLAIAPLLAAITLIVMTRLQRNAARRAHVRRAQAAARRAIIASAQQQANADPEPAAPLQTTQSTTPAGVQSTDRPARTSPVQPEQPQEQPPEEDTASEQAAPESPEMQDILSSVFADDEASTHYEALLEGLDDVDASELATMCTEIAHQMRAGSAPAAQD
jgi:hypothetical protein